jgi:Tfp pilus assembly protein PilV
MRRVNRSTRSAFALYEVMIGVTIFVIGVLALGRAVENCMNASILSAQEERVRQVLANRMAEVQTAPGKPDAKKESNVDTGFGEVRLLQRAAPAGLQNEKDVELAGLTLVTLTAEWTRGGVEQSRTIEFYVYRAG